MAYKTKRKDILITQTFSQHERIPCELVRAALSNISRSENVIIIYIIQYVLTAYF